MPLPTIIFCEHHYDVAPPVLLLGILPAFIRLGYTDFLDEMPSGTTICDLVSSYEVSQKLWCQLRSAVGVNNDFNDHQAYQYLIASRFGAGKSKYFIESFLHHKYFDKFVKEIDK